MDSIEITIQRTGAATAAAAKYLARPGSRTLTICGCGNQGRASLSALSQFFSFSDVFAYDIDESRAQKFAADLIEETQVTVKAIGNLDEAVKQSDIVVTCTPANHFFLKRDSVRPGTFVAAVGADAEHKQELEPSLLSHNKVVTDITEQCSTIGELHHALDAGLMKRGEVYAELSELIAGRKAARISDEEIIIFDSTGMALQDVIVAAAVYEKAEVMGLGQRIDMNS